MQGIAMDKAFFLLEHTGSGMDRIEWIKIKEETQPIMNNSVNSDFVIEENN